MKLAKYKYTLAAIDYLIMVIAYSLAARFTSSVKSITFIDFFILHHRFVIFCVFSPIVFLFIQQSNNLYKINIFLSDAKHFTNLVKSLFYSGITLICVAFLFKFTFILDSRYFVLLSILFAFILLIILRIYAFKKLYGIFSQHRLVRRNVLIIGAGETGQTLAAKLLIEKGLGINIIGFLDDNKKVGFEIIPGERVIGTINNLNNLSNKLRIDEIIIAIDNISYERLLEILDSCRDVKAILKISSDLFHIIPQKIITEKYHNIPVVNVSRQLNASFSFISKRIFDFIIASIGLIILSPLFVILSILIKISSKGPAIYTDTRIGKNGQPFKFYKFRSMANSNDEDDSRKKRMIDFIKGRKNQDNPDKKIVDENRITWIGKNIRKTSIDELPQLINVILGNMSLVGPRPCLPYEYEHLETWQKKRFSVLPGCTGVWQVLGRSNVSFTDSVVLDLYYINNMSPWLDLQLMLKTIPVMLFGKGGK